MDYTHEDFEEDIQELEDEDELEDTVGNNDVLLNALIDLLIQKGIIHETEFDAKVKEFSGESDDEETSPEHDLF